MDDYLMPEYCPECHGTLASDGRHLFSAPYCSTFIAEDDGTEGYNPNRELGHLTQEEKELR